MPSIGDKATASAEKRVHDRLVKIYSKARKDMMEQMKEFNARFAQKDQEKRARVKAGQMTQEDYDKWKRMQVLQSDIWRQKVEQATKTLEDANRQALRVINGEKMDVFAENANYEAYRISKDTGIGYGFSFYDKDTVGKLIREQPELMPRKVVNGKKDRAWNRTKISNAVTQSIIQGDSLPEMTERIARETAHENDAAMARYAATAMTSAQNAGRMETMERAKGMGIKVRKKWIATLDARTRDAHAELDGQVVDIDEPFVTHNRDGSLAEIMFPGDPQADGEQVWNCRCTLGYVYEEYPDEEDAERISAEYYRDEDDNLRSRPAYVKSMSYSEWKKTMQIPPKQKTTQEESELEKKLRGKSFAETLDAQLSPYSYEMDYEEYRKRMEAFKGERTKWIEDVHPGTTIDMVSEYSFQGEPHCEFARVDNAVARCYEKVPLSEGHSRLIVCDYDMAKYHLPEGENDRRLSTDAIAQVFENEGQTVIAVRRDFMTGTLDESLRERERLITEGKPLSNVFPVASPETVIMHEWGHTVHTHFLDAMCYDDEDAKGLWEWYRSLSKEEITNGLSEYGATNFGEFSAECYAEMQAPNPRPIARKYWSYMEPIIRRSMHGNQ